MRDVSELFWTASIEELKRGYVYDEAAEEYICLLCGQSYINGVIYSEGQRFYEAKKFIKLHHIQEHTSVFESLLNLDKKVTGLTDLQKNLLHMFYLGWSDADIVDEMDTGKTSTIRSHRFIMREKMKQAKVFLTIMELAEKKASDRHS